MSDIFFTSDSHYMHKNICRGTTNWSDPSRARDFDTLEEMNQTLIEGINLSVKEDDLLYHLGDWSFGGEEQINKFRNQIKCKNINIILGNHDHHIYKNPNAYITYGTFSNVHTYYEFKQKGYPLIVLFHYPIEEWNGKHHNTLHLHGHSHCTKGVITGKRRMDLSPEGNDYRPYHIDDIVDKLLKADESGT